MNARQIQNKAFSLLELSIAITTIALIIAVVAGGKKIAHNSSLTHLIGEIAKIQNANNGFYTEFAALPGDFTGGEAIWGTYHATTNPKGVEDGNGDGKIAWNFEEGFSFRKLDRAGYLPQYNSLSYTEGRLYRTTQYGDKINDRFAFTTGDLYSGNTSDTPLTSFGGGATRHQNYIFFHKKFVPGTGGSDFGAVLTPKDTYFIDQKIDDGKPHKGNIYGIKGYNAAQNTTNYNNSVACETSGKYTLTLNYVACRLAIKLESGND